MAYDGMMILTAGVLLACQALNVVSAVVALVLTVFKPTRAFGIGFLLASILGVLGYLPPTTCQPSSSCDQTGRPGRQTAAGGSIPARNRGTQSALLCRRCPRPATGRKTTAGRARAVTGAPRARCSFS
jgi:hypothetical protein